MQHKADWTITGAPLDRGGRASLVDQIVHHVETAIREGALPPGGRLPSWRDLAAQLGVARGTVKVAYEKLVDRQLLVSARSAGTHVVDPLPGSIGPAHAHSQNLLPPDVNFHADNALVFQMGVPAHDAFPATLWARLYRNAVQSTALRTSYADPRGLAELRSALASHVAITRGIECSPDQIIVTAGFRGGLSTALRAINATGRQAWVEEPGYPLYRFALKFANMTPTAIPVDSEGLNVGRGRELAPGAALAIVTPGQQAPTGVTMSPRRRTELLEWAAASGALIIEDDYLAELQLSGRPSNALASGTGADRVIHIGTFSKTISPMVGIGFIVAPLPLARRLINAATWLSTPPNAAVQLALATFLREGHYLRHLRRTRRLYSERSRRLLEMLNELGVNSALPAALSVILPLPDGVDDQSVTAKARLVGLGPAPLSPWYVSGARTGGSLLLSVANIRETRIEQDCKQLLKIIGNQS